MTAVEAAIHRIGGIAALGILGVLLWGIWRGRGRLSGRSSGFSSRPLSSPVFYLFDAVIFLVLSALGWRAIQINIGEGAEHWLLGTGSLLYFPGLAMLLWARLTLGDMYYVSSGFGAQLFAGHRLVKHGPFAILRHPMYVALVITAIGSLLVYRTWTTLIFALLAPFVLIRVIQEEKVLAEEFGEEWREYCREVPALVPRFRMPTKMDRMKK